MTRGKFRFSSRFVNKRKGKNMSKRRVVITGLGAVTPFGVGVDKFWNSLLEGKSGVSNIENIDTELHTVKIAAEIKNEVFKPEDYLDAKEAKRMDRFTQFAMVAADEAIADSGIDEANIDPYRIGVLVSSAAGGFDTFEKNHNVMNQRGPTKCSPFTVPMLIVDMASGRISIKHGYKGVNKVVVSACATGSHSIGDAFRTIQYGDADVMVAGGCEATVTNLGIGAFTAARTSPPVVWAVTIRFFSAVFIRFISACNLAASGDLFSAGSRTEKL